MNFIYAIFFFVFSSGMIYILALQRRGMNKWASKLIEPAESFNDIKEDSSRLKKKMQLASLYEKGIPEEKIISEAKKRGYKEWDMKIAIWYRKYPVKSQVVTFLIAGLFGVTVVIILSRYGFF
jgi:hypothetical protein